MFYSLLLVLSIIINQFFLVEGSFKVTINDTSMLSSPRLHAASSVVYNNALYTYGGRVGSRFSYSNKMYRYALSEDSTEVTLSSVNQTGGPNCSYCGAVMINENQMMILTNSNTSSDEVVRPYIFDFETNQWSTDLPTPFYDESLKNIFRLRRGHNTVVTDNGSRIYTIGGDLYLPQQSLNSAWYYDIPANSYNLVGGLSPRNVSYGNAVTLEDGNIGVVYGTADKGNGTFFSNNSFMNVIDVTNNRWEEGYRQLGGEAPAPAYGLSNVISPSSKFSYFMGGHDSKGSVLRGVSVLDLESFKWIKVHAIYERGSVVSYRLFSVAAILNKNMFMNVLGTSSEGYAEEKRSIDIFELPSNLENGDQPTSVNGSDLESINITWKSAIQPIVNVGIPRDAKQSFYIILVVSIVLVMIITFMVIKAADVRKDPAKNQKFAQLNWGQKIADLVIVRNTSFFTALVILGILSICIAYLAINVIQSPISTSDYDSVPLESIYIPDIRVCYSGWRRSDVAHPSLRCRYSMDFVDTELHTCDQFIKRLSSTIHAPNVAERIYDPVCYMLLASENTTVSTYMPKMQLYHYGRSYGESDAVFVEFYEPSKNPNRILFNYTDGPNMTAAEMDNWLDNERYYGKEIDKAEKSFMMYPDSEISVQFQTTYNLKLNPTIWNHIGVLPSRSNESALGIAHSDINARDGIGGRNLTEYSILGTITITPNEFAVTSSAETFDNTVLSAIGSFGGILGIAAGLYVFLFGYTPGEPWGWVQRMAVPRQRKMKKLANYFDIQEVKSIPFVTPVHYRFTEIFDRNQGMRKHNGAKKDIDVSETSKVSDEEASSIPFVSSVHHRLTGILNRNHKTSRHNESTDMEAGTNETDGTPLVNAKEVRSIPFVSSVHHRITSIFSRNHGTKGYYEAGTDEEIGLKETIATSISTDEAKSVEEVIVNEAVLADDSDLSSNKEIDTETATQVDGLLVQSEGNPRKRELSNTSTVVGDINSYQLIQELSERVSQMEARNQVLELVLKAYYINDEIFNELQTARDTLANDNNPQQFTFKK